MSDYETIVFEQSGPVARITLNRPDAANAMNHTMTRELALAAMRCDDASTKAVILTGSGRFFSAGGDLRAMANSDGGRGHFVKTIADDLHRAISTFARMDAALITAVNGVAAGAGFSLALAADVVLAAESATFTMAYTAAGLSPDGSSTYFLPRLVGLRRAQDLLLTNRTLSAEEARHWGLATEVVIDTDLAARAEETASMICDGARQSTSAVKKLLLMSINNGLEEQMEWEGRMIAACADSADGGEGIDAFFAKRPPRFA